MKRRCLPLSALLLAAALPFAARAETHTITMEGVKFAPATVTVKAGDRVVWNNKDVVPHTVTAKGVFDSGAVAVGKSWSHLAPRPGTYDYVCTFHPGMKATLVVQ